jgi:hypothetical protein
VGKGALCWTVEGAEIDPKRAVTAKKGSLDGKSALCWPDECAEI